MSPLRTLLAIALAASACSQRFPASSRPAAPALGGTGGSAGAVTGGSGPGGSGPGGTGAGGVGAGSGGFGGEPVEASALGLELTLDPICEEGFACPPSVSGTIWLATSTSAEGAPVLRASSYDYRLEVPLEHVVILSHLSFPRRLVSVPRFGDGVLLSGSVHDLRLALELLPRGAFAVREATGTAQVDFLPPCGDVSMWLTASLARVRTVAFRPPALSLLAWFGRDPVLPGDEIRITSSTSSFDVLSARVITASATSDVPHRSWGRGGRTYSFDLPGDLGLGARAMLEIEGVDLAGQPFRSEVPFTTLAPAPGELGAFFDSLAGWASQGVEIIDRGSLPGNEPRVAVSGWGRLAFEMDVPRNAAALAVFASTVARGPGGEDTFLHISALSASARTTESHVVGPALQEIAPTAVPLGYGEDRPAVVTFASDVQEVTFDLHAWAGQHVTFVLELVGSIEEVFGCPPPWSAVVLHRVSIDTD